MNREDLISGDKFPAIADLIYDNNKFDYNKLQSTFDQHSVDLQSGKRFILYTHTHWIPELFQLINAMRIPNEIILISHNGDAEVNETIFAQKPENIIKWFSNNVNFKNDIVESIPTGLENERWFPEIRKKDKMLSKMNEAKKEKNLCYMNFCAATRPADRNEVFEILKDKPYVTTDMHNNGDDFDNYIDNMYNHRFVISPRGNGIDTHRFWEALYMGSIPIDKKNINNSFYEDLPIVLVDDWKEINETFLNYHYEKIKATEYNLDMLKFSYWENKIKGGKLL